LGIDVGDADLGVLEVEKLDALVDCLLLLGLYSNSNELPLSYLLSDANADLLLLDA
jgi:hypothetical protein